MFGCQFWKFDFRKMSELDVTLMALTMLALRSKQLGKDWVLPAMESCPFRSAFNFALRYAVNQHWKLSPSSCKWLAAVPILEGISNPVANSKTGILLNVLYLYLLDYMGCKSWHQKSVQCATNLLDGLEHAVTGILYCHGRERRIRWFRYSHYTVWYLHRERPDDWYGVGWIDLDWHGWMRRGDGEGRGVFNSSGWKYDIDGVQGAAGKGKNRFIPLGLPPFLRIWNVWTWVETHGTVKFKNKSKI
jgi:hypothetical protein